MRLKTVLIVSRVTCDLIVHFALKESKLGMSGGLIYRPDFDVIKPHRMENFCGCYWIFLVPFDSLYHFDQIKYKNVSPKIHCFQVIPL